MATIYDVARHARYVAGNSVASAQRPRQRRSRTEPRASIAQRQPSRRGLRRVHAVARNLRRADGNAMGGDHLGDMTANPFFTSLVRGIEDVAQLAGYYLGLCDSDGPEEGIRLLAGGGQRADGAVGRHHLAGPERSTDIAPLLDAGTPVVVVTVPVRGIQVDRVQVDNVQAADGSTAHLLANGAPRMACITGRAGRPRPGAPGRGTSAPCGKASSRVVDPSLVRYADSREQGGYDSAMASLLGSGDPPTWFRDEQPHDHRHAGVPRGARDQHPGPRCSWSGCRRPAVDAVDPANAVGGEAAHL